VSILSMNFSIKTSTFTRQNKNEISDPTFSIQLTMTNNKKFPNSISHPIYFDLIKISVNDNFSSFVKVFGILTVTGVN
jgi:hypothetical protein